MMQYYRSNTETPGIVHKSYGDMDSFPQEPQSSAVMVGFPIQGKNIEAQICVPDGIDLVLPKTAPLFSKDNLATIESGRYTFATRYYDVTTQISEFGWRKPLTVEQMGSLIANPIHEDLQPSEIQLKNESAYMLGSTAPEEILDVYCEKIEELLGKKSIENMRDVAVVVNFVNNHLEHADIYGEHPLSMLHDINEKNKAHASCVGITTLMSWLFSAGKISNRPVGGKWNAKPVVIDNMQYFAYQSSAHSWIEIEVEISGKKVWIPIDYGNIPYLRSVTNRTYFLEDKIIITSTDTLQKSKRRQIQLLLNEIR